MLVDKILNFVPKYSKDNNFNILTGDKTKDLYSTDLKQKLVSLSVASFSFSKWNGILLLYRFRLSEYRHVLSIAYFIYYVRFSPKSEAKDSQKIFLIIILFDLNINYQKIGT